MFERVKKLFGVGSPIQASTHEQVDQPRMFAPQSEIQKNIYASLDDETNWEPWRLDEFGEQWYRRTSGVETVEAIATDDDFDNDQFEPDDLDDYRELLARDAALRFEEKRDELEGRGFGYGGGYDDDDDE